MREIKFRARNAELPRCWIYGYFIIQNDECFILNDDGKFKVIAGTQEQYTGLKDKNGKEIYEGDKIGNGVVRWSDLHAQFKIVGKDFETDMVYASSREVIGNIYENPELLEG